MVGIEVGRREGEVAGKRGVRAERKGERNQEERRGRVGKKIPAPEPSPSKLTPLQGPLRPPGHVAVSAGRRACDWRVIDVLGLACPVRASEHGQGIAPRGPGPGREGTVPRQVWPPRGTSPSRGARGHRRRRGPLSVCHLALIGDWLWNRARNEGARGQTKSTHKCQVVSFQGHALQPPGPEMHTADAINQANRMCISSRCVAVNREKTTAWVRRRTPKKRQREPATRAYPIFLFPPPRAAQPTPTPHLRSTTSTSHQWACTH